MNLDNHRRVIRWRIFFPLVNIALALGLCALGLREYRSAHQEHPGYFYHGNLYYLPSAQIAAYCLNMPAYAASSAFAEVGIRYLRSDSILFSKYSFFYVYWGFFVAVVCFWYWFGHQFDAPPRAAAHNTTIGRYAKIAIYVIGILLCLMMAYWGFVMRGEERVARPILIAKVVWGVGLSLYLLKLIHHEVSRNVASQSKTLQR